MLCSYLFTILSFATRYPTRFLRAFFSLLILIFVRTMLSFIQIRVRTCMLYDVSVPSYFLGMLFFFHTKYFDVAYSTYILWAYIILFINIFGQQIYVFRTRAKLLNVENISNSFCCYKCHWIFCHPWPSSPRNPPTRTRTHTHTTPPNISLASNLFGEQPKETYYIIHKTRSFLV